MDTGLLIALRLAKEGYGTVEELLGQPSNLVLAMWEYVSFVQDYEETLTELNRPQT